MNNGLKERVTTVLCISSSANSNLTNALCSFNQSPCLAFLALVFLHFPYACVHLVRFLDREVYNFFFKISINFLLESHEYQNRTSQVFLAMILGVFL